MSIAFVLTTVNKSVAIGEYIDNCIQFGHKDVEFIIAEDILYHPETASYLEAQAERGYAIIRLDPMTQEKFMRKFPELASMTPYRSVNRRNAGYLLAYERGNEIIVSIDDDNFPLRGVDFVGTIKNRVGKVDVFDSVSSSSGWFNSCSLLETAPNRKFYHRGFPLNKRWKDEPYTWGRRAGRCMVNAGLWLESPDVDTCTRLEEDFVITGVTRGGGGGADAGRIIALEAGIMLPFNSQNTAFHRDLIPSMFLITFPDFTLFDYRKPYFSFRYDDIWMSFFMKMALDAMGDLVCIGPPHVRQCRNEHDYIVDLRRELTPMEITAKLSDIFPKFSVSGANYLEAYQSIIENMRVHALYNAVFDEMERKILRQTLCGMEAWVRALAAI